MKSFLPRVRHAARSGASINPLMCACAAGARPIPPTLDNLAERADRDTLALDGETRVSFDEPHGRRRAATTQPDLNWYACGTSDFRARQFPSVTLECDAITVMPPQQVVERGIEQGLEMSPDGLFEVAGVEQR